MKSTQFTRGQIHKTKGTALLLALSLVASTGFSPPNEWRFSELDGGPADRDGMADGVFSSGALVLRDSEKIVIDTPRAVFALEGGLILRGSSGIVAPPSLLEGPRLTVRAGTSILMAGRSEIRMDGEERGGEVTLCAVEDIHLRTRPTVSASGLGMDSDGGVVSLFSGRRTVIGKQHAHLQANGGNGGQVIVSSCGAVPYSVVLNDAGIEALGSSGAGGQIMLASQTGIRVSTRATGIKAGGTTQNGSVIFRVGTDVDGPFQGASPGPEIVVGGPGLDSCDCLATGFLEVDAPESPTAQGNAQITGTAARPGSQIKIEGGLSLVETTSGTNRRFSVNVPLRLNRLNRLFVTELDSNAVPGPVVSVCVIQDSQAPEVFIDFPQANAELAAESTDVAGRVSDQLSGFMGLTVEVNGVAADVDVGIGTNGTFLASGVPLPLGVSAIDAVATDALGNTATTTIDVTRIEIAEDEPYMVVIDGNMQEGPVDAQLGVPLVVQVLRADDTPLAGKVVNFSVSRSNGRLSAGAPGGTMMHQAVTDGSGIAQAYWTLGSDAGCGNNRVAVTSQDIAGSIFFCASGLAGPPTQINVGSGNNQRVEAAGPALEPLRVWVSDSCNGAEGVPVTFSVVQGGGNVNGAPMATVQTSRTGHAEVLATVGGLPGNNLIQADFPGNPGNPVTFSLVGITRSLGQPTSFTGLVLDNGNQPIQGALCLLEVGGEEVSTVVTDIDGLFVFSDTLMSGPAHLHVDGLVATHVGGPGGIDVPPGSFPTLGFEFVLVPNAVNGLPGPVLLPPLDPRNAQTYDGTQDVELTVEGIEGLTMLVKQGSMRRADGSEPSPSDPAILALNQVHHDKVPMPMPDGAAPPFAWTLQPIGATFDPPISITYPNMTGLPPGSIAYFLNFNHNNGRFEIVGSGSVTEDGSTIQSDPGVGVSVAAWGCNCPPYAITEDCKKCNVKVTGPSITGMAVPQTYIATVTGSGTLSWSVTGGGASPSTKTVSVPVSSGPFITDFETTFSMCGTAGGQATPGIKVEANLTCPDGLSDQHGVGVTVGIPSGESSTFLGWFGSAAVDLSQWSGTLEPANVNFTGMMVTEDPPGSGTGTTDSCWFIGSALPRYTNANSISGGTWTVGANNTWMTDTIGITTNIDAYYTAQGRTPCAWHTVQHMKILCPSGPIEYTTNDFDWSITSSGTIISRGGVPATSAH